MSERYLFLSRQYGETAAVLSHEKVWAAIDALASQNGLSPSGLARRAGLDPTAFNPSKRVAGDGRPRWPSTESLAKVLAATGEALNTFAARVETPGGPTDAAPALVPLAGFDAASERNAFDSAGQPARRGKVSAFPKSALRLRCRSAPKTSIPFTETAISSWLLPARPFAPVTGLPSSSTVAGCRFTRCRRQATKTWRFAQSGTIHSQCAFSTRQSSGLPVLSGRANNLRAHI